MPNLRLVPVVIFAASCLLAIKAIGFLVGGPVQSTWNLETEVWQRLAGGAADPDDLLVTGTTPAARPPAPAAPRDMVKGLETAGGSGSERALIERLQERRQELEARARDLELRENLLKAAEQQLDSRLGELKDRDQDGEGEAPDRIKSLVVMYEAMGPKEAARIFDRLEPRTLVDLVNRMNPRKVSEILARMQPEAAERMTLELARGRRPAERAIPATDLRRIDAKNTR